MHTRYYQNYSLSLQKLLQPIMRDAMVHVKVIALVAVTVHAQEVVKEVLQVLVVLAVLLDTHQALPQDQKDIVTVVGIVMALV